MLNEKVNFLPSSCRYIGGMYCISNRNSGDERADFSSHCFPKFLPKELSFLKNKTHT